MSGVDVFISGAIFCVVWCTAGERCKTETPSLSFLTHRRDVAAASWRAVRSRAAHSKQAGCVWTGRRGEAHGYLMEVNEGSALGELCELSSPFSFCGQNPPNTWAVVVSWSQCFSQQTQKGLSLGGMLRHEGSLQARERKVSGFRIQVLCVQ